MVKKDKLIVLDFDGLLINSYWLLQTTFEELGLDVGDEERFKHRRKFLKYLGGGREILKNLVNYSLPKKKKIRRVLTEVYQDKGRIYDDFVPLLGCMIAAPDVHVGILSRNFTQNPGLTIRKVLRNSGVDERELDFVVPLSTGTKKHAVLEAMRSSRYQWCLFGADEVGDYRAAVETGYDDIIMAAYGFDNRRRLLEHGRVPAESIFDTPQELAEEINCRLGSTNNVRRISA